MSSDDSEPHYKFYHYYPSLAGAIVFAVLFALTTLGHAFLIAKHRTWYFIPLLIGGIFEIIGYAARAWSNKQAPNPTIGPYVVQTLLILVAPVLFAATIYMVLGRIIVSVGGEHLSMIRIRWLTKVFVISDVITFIVQMGGAALLASSNPSTSQTGSRIVLAGLILQIVIFAGFVAVAVVFHRRIIARPTSLSQHTSIPWNRYLIVLYTTCGGIMFRNIVRVAEFAEGFEGEIITHEVFLFIFDAVPMFVVMVIFNIWYPSAFSKYARKTMSDRECTDSNVELSNPEVNRVENVTNMTMERK